uniref:Putative tick transposon n=1 Tax=Rhipicephalus pulchellus TaxID=72859 RepID=L7M0T8_RHIPC
MHYFCDYFYCYSAICMPRSKCESSDMKEKHDFFFSSVSLSEATCQTELCGSEIDHMQARISSLEEELKETKAAAASASFTKEALQGKDDKVTFYTGLPSFALLMSLFQLVKSHMSHTGRNSLTQFQEMLLFLMRLRLGCQFQDLAFRFDVSLSTASRIFEKWLDLFVDRIGPLVRWPEKEQLMKTMPVAFVDNFGLKVRVILDCFEVFIDRPSSYLPRAETWSHYKHRNTVKFLVGICPQGAVSFLSKAYGGRASDKHITEECGVLDLLEYGDVVLADRGFLIAESVGMCHATLAMPAFTKGKRQLSSEDVEKTREIANVRIHVERVIGMVRNKYNILKGSLPVEVLRVNAHGECQIDKIARVCCALTNLCNSVVPFE